MAQRANPQIDFDSRSGNRRTWIQKQPAGNPRIGNGQGGTDHAEKERLEISPGSITHGMNNDIRFRKGPR